MHAQAAILTSTQDSTIALESVSANAVISVATTQTTITQTYTNDEDCPIEAVYTFPLPVDAVLLDMTVRLGERTLAGQIVPKTDAERDYEQAIDEGKRAIMLEMLEAGLYTMNVGNLQPGEQCEIEYRYALLNRWNGSTLRFSLPSTIAPRYGDPSARGLQNHQAPTYSADAGYTLDLKATLDESLSGAIVTSPSHPIALDNESGTTTVRMAPGTAAMDRDFVLNIESSEWAGSSATLAQDRKGWVVHTSFCPQVPQPAARVPLAIKLVIDCSGSMSGDSIAQAREAMVRILDSLHPGDHLSIVRFGSQHEVVTGSHAMAEVTDISRADIRCSLERMDADMGGTEIASALRAAVQIPVPDGLRGDLLLITDGNVWEHDDSVRIISDSGHRAFTVGVGSAVTEAYVRDLAEKTGGACELVQPMDNMAEKIHRHFLRMHAPRCNDVRLAWESAPSRTSPEQVPAAYDGETLHFFSWFDDKPAGEIDVKLVLDSGEEVTQSITMRSDDELVDDDLGVSSIARIAAARTIAGLRNDSTGMQTAVDYQLMSPWTNCIVVDREETGDLQRKLPELRQVPQHLAAGWGGLGRAAFQSQSVMRMSVRECSSMSSRGDFGRFSRERFFLEDESADHAEVKGPQDLARYLQAQIGLGLFTEETDLEKLASKLAAFIGKWPWEDAGADNPLLTIALAYFATLGTITPELTRHESRLVRRWYGKALREFGADDTGTRKRIREGIADSDAWKDAVTRGLGKG